MSPWKHRGSSFKVPNSLIRNGSLSYAARRMGAVLYSRRNHLGACTRSLENLAMLAHCSIATARKALDELEQAGFLTRSRNYRYDYAKGRVVYAQTTYRLLCNLKRGFTFIPWSIFGKQLKDSAFAAAMYLYFQAGNRSVAFPSLNHVVRDIWMAKSTLCRALKALDAAGLMMIQHCWKRCQCFGHNSYFILCAVKTPTMQLLNSALEEFWIPFPCPYCTPSQPDEAIPFACEG